MKNRFLFGFIILAAIATEVKANPTDDGKNIFTARCAACHNVNKTIVGPALNGIDKRRPIDWIISFIHSSQTVVKSGDSYAVALFEKFNKVAMPDHPDLTVDNIKSIVEYIKSQSTISSADKPPFVKPGKMNTGYLPLSLQKDYWFFISYLVVVGVLIVSLLFVVQLKRFQNEKLNKGNAE